MRPATSASSSATRSPSSAIAHLEDEDFALDFEFEPVPDFELDFEFEPDLELDDLEFERDPDFEFEPDFELELFFDSSSPSALSAESSPSSVTSPSWISPFQPSSSSWWMSVCVDT
jgi:hypothetical protein